MAVLNNPAGLLANAISAEGLGGVVLDCRHTRNYAYLVHYTPTRSAQFQLQASHDTTGWMIVATYTATSTSGSAQLAGYYPYVRVNVNELYSGSSETGAVSVFYAPGL